MKREYNEEWDTQRDLIFGKEMADKLRKRQERRETIELIAIIAVFVIGVAGLATVIAMFH